MSHNILPIRNKLLEQWGPDLLATQALPEIAQIPTGSEAGGKVLPESVEAEFRLNESFDAYRNTRTPSTPPSVNCGRGALLLAGVQKHGLHTEITTGAFIFDDSNPQPPEAQGRLRAYGNLFMRPCDLRPGRGRNPHLGLEYTLYDSGHAFVWGDIETGASEYAELGDYGRLGEAWETLGLNSLEPLPEIHQRRGDWTTRLLARIGSSTAPEQIGSKQIEAFMKLVDSLHRGEVGVPDKLQGTLFLIKEGALERLEDAIEEYQEYLKNKEEDDD